MATARDHIELKAPEKGPSPELVLSSLVPITLNILHPYP